jgi:hypothetical protein
MQINQQKCLKPKIRERKLTSGVNLARGVKAKRCKTNGRKTRYGFICIRKGPVSFPGEDIGCPD